MAERYVPGRWVKLRLYGAGVVLASLFGLLGYRAFVLQVREAERLKAMAEDQYLKDVELPPKRGRILDRNGAELAASAEVDSVHANARLIQAAGRVEETARALEGVLHVERRELEKRLRVRRFFSWLKRRVTPEEARAVKALGLQGVYLAKEPRRYYPNRGLAGPLLGWAGLDARGQEGIELQFDRWLRGARTQVPGLRDALGRAVLVGGLGDVSEVSGHDLYTTLDRYIQFRLERALEKGVQTHRAKAAVAVALDPNNGEILAMAAVPSLNPNDPDGARERGVRNRAVTDPFEPGSTMKTFTLAGALEAGVIRVDDRWYCENGKWQVGPATIHDAERIGDTDTTGVLAMSSNICTAKIAQREGKERLREVLLRFGFGKPTGVDLPGERAGNVRSVPRMGPVETATMSFGQGLTATPLQIAAGYAAIANGGTWYRPHVMRKVVDGAGVTVQASDPQKDARRVLPTEVAASMRQILHAVTQPGGTGERLKLPGYLFGGKTGTAQKVDPVTRRYSPDKWASSFVGFAPKDDPRLVIFVMVDEPQGTHYGSMVAGPVFQEVMADALRWLGVPPTEPADPKVDGRGEVARAEPASGPAPAASPDRGAAAGEADPAPGEGEVVPDFTGLSVAEALKVAERAGLRIEVVGSGEATHQLPGPGEPSPAGDACRVVFTPPG